MQLEIGANGFAMTQNSVKFLPNGIQISVDLPPCLVCQAADVRNDDRANDLLRQTSSENSPQKLEPEQVMSGGRNPRKELKFVLKLSTESTESQHSHSVSLN